LYLNCTFNKTEVHKVTNIKSKNLFVHQKMLIIDSEISNTERTLIRFLF